LKHFLFTLATALTLSFAQPRIITITPGENVASIVNAAPEGSTVRIEAGRYFISEPLKPRANVTIEGVGSVVIHGSRLLENWNSISPTRHEVGGQLQEGSVYTNPDWQVCENTHPRCNRPDDVFMNSVPLKHVDSSDKLAAGTFFFDYPRNVIAVGTNPNGAVMEAAITPFALQSSASGVVLRNLTFEKFATPTERAAIELNGAASRVEGVIVRLTHGNGVVIKNDGIVRDSRLIDNGQSGGGAAGVGGLYEGNEIARNNYAGHAVSFSAGGLSKGANSTNLTIRNNRVFDNFGEGIWLDSYNRDALIENNTVYGNTRSGIFYELSYGGTVIRNNSVRCNGGYGQINNTSSAGTADDPILITGNTITVCAGSKGEALAIRNDGRRPTDYVIVEGNTFRFEETRGKVIQDAWNGGSLGAITFTDNVFYVLNDGRYWRWDGTDRTWNEWAARYPGDTRIVGLPIPTKAATLTATVEPPATRTPMLTPSQTPTATSTASATVTASPEIETATAIPDIVWRFEIIIRGWKLD
jgi:parallel beta-helix repeat protein